MPVKELDAPMCPCVSVGDAVGSSTVKSAHYNYFQRATCPAFKAVKLVRLADGTWKNPGNLLEVPCKNCPVLRENPKSREESKDFEQLAPVK